MRHRILALSALLVPFAGCDQDPAYFWQAKPDLMTPPAGQQVAIPLADRVAFIDKGTATAFILDPADPSLAPRRVKVGKAPIAAAKHKASNKLLVLSRGDKGSVDESPTPAELDVIDTNPTVPNEQHVLDGRFESMAQSEDGRFVVLYHRADQTKEMDSTLYYPNELLIIDFASGRETGKSIRSLGSVPADIVFLPALAPTEPTLALLSGRRLAVVLALNYVTLLDLDNPDRTEISIPLCLQSTGCAISPKQVVLDATNLRIFVRAEGTSDIFQIELRARESDPLAPPDPLHNDFRASASMQAVGGAPADMVLYGTGTDSRLAVAAPSAYLLVVIDPGTSSTVNIPTSIPVNRIIPFTDSGTGVPSHALLLDNQRGSTSVLFAALPNVESLRSLALEDYAIGTAIGDIIPLLNQRMVVLLSASRSGSSAVTIVDVDARSFRQIGSGSTLANATVETRAPSRLWAVTSDRLLSYMNLYPRPNEPVGTGEIWLDQPIVSIDPLLEPSADGRRYLVVGHSDPRGLGNVTFLDADNPDRATARTAYGFTLTDYLEREQP